MRLLLGSFCTFAVACSSTASTEPTAPPQTCGESIDAYCAHAPCIQTFSEARPRASLFCQEIRHNNFSASVEPCHGYAVLRFGATDTGTEYYYDAASGELAAVLFVSATSDTPICGAARAPTFSESTCGDDTYSKPRACEPTAGAGAN